MEDKLIQLAQLVDKVEIDVTPDNKIRIKAIVGARDWTQSGPLTQFEPTMTRLISIIISEMANSFRKNES